MSTSKKKNRKVSWIMFEEGHYMLQDGNDLAVASSSFNEQTFFSTFISNNVFCGEIVAKKTKAQKVSEVLNDMVEIHPNTMQLCGLTIGGPVVLSSSTCAFATRVWPSFQLHLNHIALPSRSMSYDGFSVGSSIFATSPKLIETAAKITFIPDISSNDDSFLQSLIKETNFLKYLTQYLDKTYVIAGQTIQVYYFGKLLTFCAENVVGSNEDTINMSSFAYEPNNSLTDKVKSLKLEPKSKSFSSSTPLRNDSGLNSHREMNGFKHSMDAQIEQDCYFQSYEKVLVLTSKTAIEIKTSNLQKNQPSCRQAPAITFLDVGGLKDQKEALEDLVIAPVKNPTKFKQVGIQPLHGVILYGASGTGKSLLAKAVANELGGSVKTVVGSQVIGKFFGESETKLRAIFDEAVSQAPCVVIIDEVDSLCPRRDVTRTDAEKRLVAAFTAVLDDLNSTNQDSHVIVIGTTNRLEAIDPVLRRSGRFDREIEVTIPTSGERLNILQILLKKFSHNLTIQKLQDFAEKCHGYVGADLLAVCKEAGLHSLKNLPSHGDGTVSISISDLDYGIKQIPPSAMRELIVDVPKVYWKDIGGNDVIKQKLKHAVEWPLKNPEAFARLGIDPPRGVLLYGPPGCSKTLTAKALATESGLNFISIKGPELFSKFVGDSEKAIRKIFAKARSAAPSIVFIDELDALAIERGSGNSVADRVLTTLLTEMDGVEHSKDVIVVAATNRPDMIDKAFLRPGRIDRILHVPLPNSATRREIFVINFRKMPVDSSVDVEQLIEQTETFSGAEICALCREAALAALDDNINATTVSKLHFEAAFKTVIPQTSEEMTKLYEKYEQTLQSRIK